MSADYSLVPADLKEQRRWVAWKFDGDHKPPIDANGRKVDVYQKPDAWLTFDEALARAAKYGDGIGFVMGDGFSGFDLDDCLDPETRKLDERAEEYIHEFCPDAYAEVSPSGKGVKLFGRGLLPPVELKFNGSISRGSDPWYFTVTGDAINTNGLGDLQPTLEVANSHWPLKRTAAKAPTGTIGRGDQHNALINETGSLRRRGHDDEATFAMLRAWADARFDPCPTDRDLWSIVRSTSGWQDAAESLLDPKQPMVSARLFVGDRHLRHQAGLFWAWSADRNSWASLEEPVVRAQVWAFLDAAKKRGEDGPKPFCPTGRAVSEVVDAVRAVTNLPASYASPCWLDGRDETTGLIAFRNGLLRTSDGTLLPPDPAFYNHIALPFDYEPDVKEAPEWQTFLKSLWPDDPDSIESLQDIFGCFVAGDLRFQKIFMLVGPKRGGKDTMARVLRDLLGHANVCGPTLSSLGETFGRECLIGKSAAIISDARLTGRADPAVVVEELLAISGEGGRTVQRKFLPAWSGQLRVRFLILTNELPRIEDASGALASRFVILRLTQSFYGREDLGLYNRLVPELPAILNWALEGWERVRSRGYFKRPESAEGLVQQFEDLGSPIRSFVRDCCDEGPYEQEPQPVFEAWRSWCARNGRQHVGTLQTFAKDLRAALAGVDMKKVGGRGQQRRVWVGVRLKPKDEMGSLKVPFGAL